MGHTPADDGREVFGVLFAEPLDGGDFVVRQWHERDVLPSLALIDDEIRTRLGLPDGLDAPTARSMLLHGGAVAIVDASTDQPLGGMRLFLHGDAVEFGYWLGPRARGRGIATRALELVSSKVVADLRPSRLELRTTIGNLPSERVAARVGFERVGLEPPIEYPGGRVSLTTLWVREPG